MATSDLRKPGIPVYAIVGMDEERAIGKNGSLPWYLPQDLKHFSSLTKGHTVLMGRKTFDSLPEKFKPLPQRLNLVLSRSKSDLQYENTRFFSDLDAVVEFCAAPGNILGQALWIIGGSQLYKLTSTWWDKVYLTRIDGSHEGDVFFPKFEENFDLIESEPSDGCRFEVYQRRG